MAKQEDINELAESIEFMRSKLAETREIAESQDLIVDYDNGGGQRGTRANPIFAEFEKLLASYTKAVELYEKLEGDGEADGQDDISRLLASRKTGTNG